NSTRESNRTTHPAKRTTHPAKRTTRPGGTGQTVGGRRAVRRVGVWHTHGEDGQVVGGVETRGYRNAPHSELNQPQSGIALRYERGHRDRGAARSRRRADRVGPGQTQRTLVIAVGRADRHGGRVRGRPGGRRHRDHRRTTGLLRGRGPVAAWRRLDPGRAREGPADY